MEVGKAVKMLKRKNNVQDSKSGEDIDPKKLAVLIAEKDISIVEHITNANLSWFLVINENRNLVCVCT